MGDVKKNVVFDLDVDGLSRYFQNHIREVFSKVFEGFDIVRVAGLNEVFEGGVILDSDPSERVK